MLDKNIVNRLFNEINEAVNNEPNPLLDTINLFALINDINSKILEPKAIPKINERLQSKIDSNAKIQSEIDSYNVKIKEYESLIENEASLREILKEKILLSDKIKELELISEELNNSNLDSLKLKITELESKENFETYKYLDLLNSLNSKFEKVQSRFENFPIIAALIENHDNLEKKAYSLISNLEGDLNMISIASKKTEEELELLKNEYNTYINKLKTISLEMSNIKEIHFKNIEIWNLHFSANTEIWGEINKDSKVEEFISKQSENFDIFLKDFDSKILTVLNKLENTPFYEYLLVDKQSN